MDLTGQLSNIPEVVRSLSILPLKSRSSHSPRPRSGSWFLPKRHTIVRAALIHALSTGPAELRLQDLRRRVEIRLGEPVPPVWFKDYVNAQSKGPKSILERLGYGR